MRIALVTCLLALAAAGSFAADENDVRLEKMAAVPDLVGKWEGGGWIRQGPGEPIKFVGEETVEARLGGRVLIVEGKHYTADRSQVVHHALATLSFDREKNGYSFDTWLVASDGGSFPAKVENGALIWERPNPERPARFIIRVENDTWNEIGEIRIEGTWRKFFEMNLKRVK
jgi:hypothetical protein